MNRSLHIGKERRADEDTSDGALPENGNGSADAAATRARPGLAPVDSTHSHPSHPQAAIPHGEAPEVLLRDARYRRSLATADILAATLALFVGISLIGNDELRPAILILLPVLVLVSKTMGLYDRDEHLLCKTTLDEAPSLFQVATLFALITWLGEKELFVTGDLGRDQVLGLWALLFLGMMTVRSVGRYLVRARSEPERCLIIGDEQLAGRVRRKLDSSMSANAVAVGRVPLASDRRRHDGRPPRGRERRSVSGLPNVGTIESLGLVLAEHEIDRAIVAPPVVTSEHMLDVTDEMLDVVRLVRSMGVKVSVLPRLFEVVGSSVELDDVEGMILLGLRPDGLTKSSRFLKRAMDLTGAGLGLVVLSPALAAVAAAVKLSSPGPVLFRQQRIGRGGAEFSILKFRTMVDGAEDRKEDLHPLNEAADGLFKIADDPRLTPVGRFLRRTSLDELPQLINVLRGEMSLVGPRPLIPEEDRRIEGWARRRLHSAPGMTGVWQVFGSSRVPLHEMVKIDYLYCANWSLWLDVKILLRTVPHALGRRGL